MTAHQHTPPDGLTKNQSLVYGALSHATGPLSAYAILDQLREHGFRAPLQVYRALDKLIDLGLIHRLESLNSFVACRHPDCGHSESMVFAICDLCGSVSEMTDASLNKQLTRLAGKDGFLVDSGTIELRGRCRQCQQKHN